MALLQPELRREEGVQASTHLRRCTFRRMTSANLHGGAEPVYDVQCLYPDREAPLPLGDAHSASTICGQCTAPGIFRADED